MFDHWNAHHTEPELWQLAEDWVTEPRPGWAHADDVLVEWMHDAPDKALAFMCAVLQITQDPATVSFLAAGPLEDLFCIHGEAILDTICTRARRVSSAGQRSVAEFRVQGFLPESPSYRGGSPLTPSGLTMRFGE